MKTRQTLLLGLAGLGFVLAMPAHAASPENSALMGPGFTLAARDNAEARQEQRRETKEEERRGSKNQNRDAERPQVQQEYGYGYERRQLAPARDEGRHRQ